MKSYFNIFILTAVCLGASSSFAMSYNEFKNFCEISGGRAERVRTPNNTYYVCNYDNNEAIICKNGSDCQNNIDKQLTVSKSRLKQILQTERLQPAIVNGKPVAIKPMGIGTSPKNK